DEPEQAQAALDQAVKKLEAAASDAAKQAFGDLLLFRAECHASAGRHAQADADLAAAKPIVPPVVWHRAAARVCRIKPDLAASGAWALRQRGLVLADGKQLDEALAEVQKAAEIEPGHPWYYAVYAQVLKRADRTDEALEAIRTSLRENVDQEPMIGELVQLS